jgi:zinc transport system permease protein
MLEIFQYSFMVRAFEAGLIIAVIAPLIGIFLVLRRYSLIADALAHISLAGVAVGLITKINPIITATITSIGASFAIERLRTSRKVYGESALALFLSGGLAIAVTLISLSGGFSVDLFSYLFGSIVTVKQSDIFVIFTLGLLAIVLILGFYKQLVYVSFDEETAQVTGINTKAINTLLIILTAVTVSVSMRIVGILLISALIVIPVITALQFKKSFKGTLIIAEIISLFSVVSGIFASYYLNIAAGGAIVLVALIIFCLSLILKS